jgi:hypothetical protein
MRKVTITLVFSLIAATSLISCKKDYTCKCTVNISFMGTTTTADSSYVISKSTKKNAKNNCNQSSTDLNSQAALLGGSGSCSLK